MLNFNLLRGLLNVGCGQLSKAQGATPLGTGIFGPAVWRSRAWSFDCDQNLHLNNAKYFQNMELAQWHMLSSGTNILGQALRKRWAFLIASQMIRHKFSIKLNQEYEIQTQVVALDEQYVYVHQRFFDERNRLCAAALVSIMIREGKTTVLPSSLLELAGI
ncbi:unnamed protein product, partial [Heterosigma akashiwo]